MTHGTATAYANHGCRCSECREAQRIRVAEYRRRKRRQRDLAWNPDPRDGFWDRVDRTTTERLAV